jgi:hypothetical protein
LLPALSQAAALRTIELVHCCHQDDSHKTPDASASVSSQSCWSNLVLLTKLQSLKHITLRYPHLQRTYLESLTIKPGISNNSSVAAV